LVLAKARSAAPIPAVLSAKRATQASAKINATVDGARHASNSTLLGQRNFRSASVVSFAFSSRIQ
jgi:hypothetical protein